MKVVDERLRRSVVGYADRLLLRFSAKLNTQSAEAEQSLQDDYRKALKKAGYSRERVRQKMNERYSSASW